MHIHTKSALPAYSAGYAASANDRGGNCPVSEGRRVIYLFYNDALPVFLLAMYGKNETPNEMRWRKLFLQLFRATSEAEGQNDTNEEAVNRSRAKKAATVGARIIEGLEALAWSKGEDVAVRVTQVQVRDVDVSQIRRRMGLSKLNSR